MFLKSAIVLFVAISPSELMVLSPNPKGITVTYLSFKIYGVGVSKYMYIILHGSLAALRGTMYHMGLIIL
jgi:hypothetical protein